MSKCRFTPAQHQAVGRTLKQVDGTLWDLHQQLQTTYGKTHRAAQLVWRMVQSGGLLDRLRLTLDECLHKELPPSSASYNVYWGQQPESSQNRPCSTATTEREQ